MQKKYDFDEIISRDNTGCLKYDFQEKYFGARDLIPLWVADMDFRTPDFIVTAMKRRLNHEIFGYFFKQDSLYQSIADWMKKRHQWEIKPEWIVFSPGVMPSIAMAILSLTRPGDAVIVQPPVYPPFFHVVTNNERRPAHSPLQVVQTRYYMDFDDLAGKADDGAKMVLLCNPHNPVGRVWNRKELQALGQLCIDKDLIILSDEIHSDLILPGYKHIPIASLSPEVAERTITAIAPSKTFNIAGLSSSALIIPNKDMRERYNDILDKKYYLEMGTVFGVTAMEAAYTCGEEWLEQLMAYLNENYRMAQDFIISNIPKIKVTPLEGTYLLWIDFRNIGVEYPKLKEFLVHQAKISLYDGKIFGKEGEGFQRLNLACPRSVLHTALERLKNAVDNA